MTSNYIILKVNLNTLKEGNGEKIINELRDELEKITCKENHLILK